MPKSVSESDLQEFIANYRASIPDLTAPDLEIPTLVAPPNVLEVIEPQRSLGSTDTLETHHIPTLLNNLSKVGVTIPRNPRAYFHDPHFSVPAWEPPNRFPAAPTQPVLNPLPASVLTLNLPLYTLHSPGSRLPLLNPLREWWVEKLNDVVRGIHIGKISSVRLNGCRFVEKPILARLLGRFCLVPI